MFASSVKSTGTTYTTTVALLLVAFLFVPAVWAVSRPSGYLSMSVAIGCCLLCTGLAWVSWSRFSRLTIPSIEQPAGESRQ